MRARFAQLASACVLVASGTLVACGDGADGDPAAMVPPDVPLYGEAVLRPDDDQREAIESLTGLVAGIDDPGAEIVAALDESLAEEPGGLTYAEDIEPWLGDRAAIGFTSVESLAEEELVESEVAAPDVQDPDFVIAIETSDEQIASDSIDRLLETDGADEIVEEEIGGQTVRRVEGEEMGVALVDGVLVLGNTDAALERAFAAHDGDSLAGSDEYEASFEGLPEERLASGYLDFGVFVELAGQDDPEGLEAFRALYGDAFDQPAALAVTAGETSLVVDASSAALPFTFPTASPSDLLAAVPGDSLAALGFDDVGAQLRALYDAIVAIGVEETPGADPDVLLERLESELGVSLDEVTAALGDGAAYLRGELPDAFSVGFELDLPEGPDTPSALLDSLRTELEGSGWIVGPPLGSGADGLSAENRGAEEIRFLNVAIADDTATISAAPDRETAEAVPSTDDELGGSELYAGAEELLGADYDLIGLADPGGIIEQASEGGSVLDVVTGESTPEQVVADFLAQRLEVAALGLRESDDRVYTRLAVGIE